MANVFLLLSVAIFQQFLGRPEKNENAQTEEGRGFPVTLNVG